MKITVELDLDNDLHYQVLQTLAGRTEAPSAASDKTSGTRARPKTEKPSEAPLEASEAPSLDQEALDQAVRKATAMLKEDKQANSPIIREALAQAGVAKVTMLSTDAQVQAFMKALG